MTKMQKPVINPAELDLEHWQEGTFFESRDVSFGAMLGLRNLGIGYGEVPPGKSGCPFHNHYIEEELFVILSGEGEYRLGADRHPVKPGDVLGAPAGGPETAHHLKCPPRLPFHFRQFHCGYRRISGFRQVFDQVARDG